MYSKFRMCSPFFLVLVNISLLSYSSSSIVPRPSEYAEPMTSKMSNGPSFETKNSLLSNRTSHLAMKHENNSFLRELLPEFRTIVDDDYIKNHEFTVNDSSLALNDSTIVINQPENRNLSRSEAKCFEYFNFTRRAVVNPYFARRNKRFHRDRSGPVSSTCLVNGSNVLRAKFPHVVALGKLAINGSFDFQCGGSLVSPNWILTAAHCTHGSGRVKIARLGINRLSENTGMTVGINRTIRHSSYRPPAFYGDIALLELERSVRFTESIQPACLHQRYSEDPSSAWLCGWGAVEFGGVNSDILQEAYLDLVDNATCSMQHGSSIAVPDGLVPSMICAGAPRDNWEKDACQGDSGGPLQISYPIHDGAVHRIIGITSFGKSCAFPNSPGVYTRVSYYLDWIESIVWPVDNNLAENRLAYQYHE